jgi:hypothetical protein
MPVLWESTTRLDDSGWELSGLTGNYLRVVTTAPRAMWNEVSRVRLQALRADALIGEITS